jgi:hypothetical protein
MLSTKKAVSVKLLKDMFYEKQLKKCVILLTRAKEKGS